MCVWLATSSMFTYHCLIDYGLSVEVVKCFLFSDRKTSL